VLRNAVAWFAACGVSIERVLSDNGSAYKSHAWHDACTELGIRPEKTRPYRPQTNGKIERFHRTLADGWVLGRFCNSEQARRKALLAWPRFDAIRGLETRIGWGHVRERRADQYEHPAQTHRNDHPRCVGFIRPANATSFRCWSDPGTSWFGSGRDWAGISGLEEGLFRVSSTDAGGLWG
jgi:hypothetical protein